MWNLQRFFLWLFKQNKRFETSQSIIPSKQYGIDEVISMWLAITVLLYWRLVANDWCQTAVRASPIPEPYVSSLLQNMALMVIKSSFLLIHHTYYCWITWVILLIDIRTNIWTYWWCDKMALSFLISHKCYKQHINAKLFFDLRNDRPLQVIYWSLLQNNDLPLKCSRCHFIFFPSSRRHKCKCQMLIRCWNKRTCEIFSNIKTLCPIPLNKKTSNSMCVDLGYFTGALQDFQFSTDNNVQKVLYYVSIDVLSSWKFIGLVYFVLFGLYYPFTHKVSGCLLWLHTNHPMQTHTQKNSKLCVEKIVFLFEPGVTWTL